MPPAEPGQLLQLHYSLPWVGVEPEFPTSRNTKATVTHGGCSPTEVDPPDRDAANPLFWGTQHLPKLQDSEGHGQLMQQPLSPGHGTALGASQVPPRPTCPHKGARRGRSDQPDLPHTRLRGSPGPPPADPSPGGALTKMARLKRIIITLINVKHPIFAPGGEQRGYRGNPHPAQLLLSRKPWGDQGGTEPDLPVRRADPNTSARPATLRSASTALPVPPFIRGASRGRPRRRTPPRPARPAGATPRCRGEPAALLPSAAGSLRGTTPAVSPRSPCCHGGTGRQRYQPRGCFTLCRRLQLRGYHPAALLGVLGAVLGLFQLWAPPALTAPGHSLP